MQLCILPLKIENWYDCNLYYKYLVITVIPINSYLAIRDSDANCDYFKDKRYKFFWKVYEFRITNNKKKLRLNKLV